MHQLAAPIEIYVKNKTQKNSNLGGRRRKLENRKLSENEAWVDSDVLMAMWEHQRKLCDPSDPSCRNRN